MLTEPLIDRLIARARAGGATIVTGDRGTVTALAPGEVRTADGQVLASTGRRPADGGRPADRSERAGHRRRRG